MSPNFKGYSIFRCFTSTVPCNTILLAFCTGRFQMPFRKQNFNRLFKGALQTQLIEWLDEVTKRVGLVGGFVALFVFIGGGKNDWYAQVVNFLGDIQPRLLAFHINIHDD